MPWVCGVCTMITAAAKGTGEMTRANKGGGGGRGVGGRVGGRQENVLSGFFAARGFA